MILKKKIDGYRDSGRSIKNVPPELLLELRQAWEHYTGTSEKFRSELGMKSGTLRNLLKASRKLNHVLASSGAIGLAVGGGAEQGFSAPDIPHAERSENVSSALILTFDNGSKTIHFPNVDLLIDFIRRAA